MSTLEKVKNAMLSPYCVSDETRKEVKMATSIEDCITILAREYHTDTMTGALAFLAVMRVLNQKTP